MKERLLPAVPEERELRAWVRLAREPLLRPLEGGEPSAQVQREAAALPKASQEA